MKPTAILRLYDQLAPIERFSLLVEAQARGDRVEVDRLVRSTPNRRYVMHDVAVVELWEQSFRTSAAFLLLWHSSYWRWVFSAGLLSAGGDQEHVRDLHVESLIDLTALVTALDLLCEYIGVSSESFFSCWLSALNAEVAEIRRLISEIPKTDEASEKSEEYYALFRQHWPELRRR